MLIKNGFAVFGYGDDEYVVDLRPRLPPQPKQVDIDRMARELYQTHGHCRQCRQAVPLADALQCRCPHCEAIYLLGAITPERGRAMLAELRARRRELGP